MESIRNTQTHARISTSSSSLTPQSSDKPGHPTSLPSSNSHPRHPIVFSLTATNQPTNHPTDQPDPFLLPAAVGSLNYATTPVECSDVWTNFLHCMTFELLRCVPVFRLDPVCTCDVCARMCACSCACFLYVFCARVVRIAFVSVEWIHVCVYVCV